MAQLIPRYYWQDRAEWLVLEALKCADHEDGWIGVREAWGWWTRKRAHYHCPERGGGISTFKGKLEKFRILGWVESRPNPQSAGKTIRGQERVEWRLCPGLGLVAELLPPGYTKPRRICGLIKKAEDRQK